HRARAWFRSRGLIFTFLYVWEVQPKTLGYHCHFLIHVPHKYRRAFQKIAPRWTTADCSPPSNEHVLKFSRSRYTSSVNMTTASMRFGHLLYCLKGTDHRAYVETPDGRTHNAAALLGIQHRGEQGDIRIKRAGTSANIGPSAQAKAGFDFDIFQLSDFVGANRRGTKKLDFAPLFLS